jgi:hypothetical protein
VLFKVFGEAADFRAWPLEGNTGDYLRQFDVVLIQDLEAPEQARPELHRLLREYVEQGGGLLLVHETLSGLGSPFPDITPGIARPPAGAPLFDGFVEDATMVVAGDGLQGFERGERFPVHWAPHPLLEPGPRGRVILRDSLGFATAIIGEHGRGRVAFVVSR